MTALLTGRSSRALSKARAEVDRLEQAVTRWQSDAAVKRAALDDLEAGAGDAVLADETGTVARQLAVDSQELRFSIDGANRAAQAAQRQLRAAQWAVADAEASQLRDQAATVLAEAEKRQARILELVAQIEEYEGGRWVEWVPERGAFGTYNVSARRTPPLFEQARALDAQAAAIEERVAAERRQAAVLVPTAEIHWRDGEHYRGTATAIVAASVNDGLGELEFEVVVDGRVIDAFTLPDGNGRRGRRKPVDVFAEGTLSVRAAGQVLASRRIELPPGTVNLSHPLSIR